MTAEFEFTGPAVLESRTVPSENEGHVEGEWQLNEAPYPRVYHLVLHEEQDETAFSAYCLELPGAVSEGANAEEALDGLREAIQALVEAYGELGEPVPWEARQLEDGDEIASVITLDG